MQSRTREQFVSAAAITLYIGSFLTIIWMYAHDFARNRNPDVDGLAWLVVVFVVPLIAGFGIGRYWALALVLFLFISTGVVSELEPLQREPIEVEGGPLLFSLFTAVVHAPLLLVGVWIRKRVAPRDPTKKRLFSLHPPMS